MKSPHSICRRSGLPSAGQLALGFLGIFIAVISCSYWLSVSIHAAENNSRPELALQTGHIGNVGGAAFSPDSRTVATGGDDWNVKLWNVSSGEVIRTLIGHTAGVTTVIFSRDGKSVVSGSDDGSVKFWDVTTGKIRVSLTDPDRHMVTVISISPNQKLLASGVGGGGGEIHAKIRLWDLATNVVKLTLNEASDGVTGLVFSPDSKTLISSSKDGKLKIWNLNSGALERQLDAHSGEITSLASSPNGSLIASGSVDGTVKLWDAPAISLKHAISGDANQRNQVGFSPDGNKLLVGALEVRTFDSAKGTPLQTFEKKTLSSSAVLFSPDGKTAMNIGVALGTDAPDYEVHLWNAKTALFNRKLSANIKGVITCLLSSDRHSLIVGDLYKRVMIWDLQTGSPVRLMSQPAELKAVVASPDGKYLATGGGDFAQPGFISLWEMQTGKLIRTFPGPGLPVRSVAFSPNGRRLAASSEDSTVTLWNVETGTLEKTLKDNNLPVHAVLFSSDGRQLLTGSLDGKLRFWDVEAGTLTDTIKVQTSGVFTLALSPDGTLVASGGPETSAISVWEVATRQLKKRIADYMLSPTALSFINNTTVIASNVNGRVSLWDLLSGKSAGEVTTHELMATCVSNSGDSYVASGAHDNSVHLVDLKTKSLLAVLHSPRPQDFDQLPPSIPRNSAGEFFAINDQGYYFDSPIADRTVRLRTGGLIFAAGHFRPNYYRPSRVRQSLKLD